MVKDVERVQGECQGGPFGVFLLVGVQRKIPCQARIQHNGPGSLQAISRDARRTGVGKGRPEVVISGGHGVGQSGMRG